MTELTLFIGLDVYTRRRFRCGGRGRGGRRSALLTDDRQHPGLGGGPFARAVEGRAASCTFATGGPCGYGVHRQLTRSGTLRRGGAGANPRKVGDRVKTDRRDAMMLAQTLRAGQLTAVWVPDEAHERWRDLGRCARRRCATCARRASSC